MSTLSVRYWPFIRGRDTELIGCCRPISDCQATVIKLYTSIFRVNMP